MGKGDAPDDTQQTLAIDEAEESESPVGSCGERVDVTQGAVSWWETGRRRGGLARQFVGGGLHGRG